MKARWEDLTVRTRGLATHLLTPGQLDALARAPDLDALGDAFRALGLLVPEAGAVTPEQLELAVRRAAAARLHTLTRWAGARKALLAVVFEDEDRRSLRAMLRGAVHGAPPEERLGGVIPTPALPERALGELARQPTTGAVAALLTAWGSPYGTALLPDAAATHPDLLTLEYRLNRAFAARALEGARAARSRQLVEFVRDTIDLENAATAFVLGGAEKDAPSNQAFLDGGRRLPLAAFLDAIAAREPNEVGRRLAAAFRPDPLGTALERHANDPAALEEALLRQRIATLRARAWWDPMGPATVLGYVLQLRAEMLDLRRAIWGVALGAPPPPELAPGLAPT
jgi:vacuolar-type H+-ATPase subunit C/Vma6